VDLGRATVFDGVADDGVFVHGAFYQSVWK
jgi:hypothetical protein